MSGTFAASKRESYRIEVACLCDAAAAISGLRCPYVAFNAVQNGHDGAGTPYISYYCDEHDRARLL